MTTKKKEYTQEEIDYAWRECPSFLSKAITHLFDDVDRGGLFYGHILQSCARDFTDKIPTAAVSVTDKINLYINPVFWVYELDNVTLRKEVLRHEILHLVFHHCYRGKDFGNRELANIAADLVVNSYVDKKAFGEFAKAFMFAERFKLPPEESMKFYYENFPLKDNPICETPSACDKEFSGKGKSGGSGSKDSSEGDSGDGSGEGHSHEHAVGEDGKCKVCGGYRPYNSHEVWDESEGEKISESLKKSLLDDAVARAADACAKSAGNLPGFIQRAIEAAKKKAEIPWNHILRQFVARASGTRIKKTKKRFSKRFDVRPGSKIEQLRSLLVSVDVSGSISDEEYVLFMGEIFNILKTDGTGSVFQIEWDAAITSKDKRGRPGAFELKSNHKVVRTGSGGTNPNQALEWANANKGTVAAQIIFTDGYLFDRIVPPKVPTIWVLTSNGSDEHLKGQRVIKLPDLSKKGK